jgi:hypothetical protein
MPNAAPEPQDVDEAPDPLVLLAESRLRMLRRLAEIGMELAERTLNTETAPAKGRDPADFYAPISRAIRLTLALEEKTAEKLRDLKAGIVREREEELTRTAERRQAAAEERETKVRRLVIQAADAEISDVEVMDGIFGALDERLDEDEAYEDFAERPLRETVERLCHDLALNPDWSRWDGEGWIKEGPPVRPLHSEFINKQSRTPITWQWPRPESGQPAHQLE